MMNFRGEIKKRKRDDRTVSAAATYRDDQSLVLKALLGEPTP